jgi:hypothetical protein
MHSKRKRPHDISSERDSLRYCRAFLQSLGGIGQEEIPPPRSPRFSEKHRHADFRVGFERVCPT